MTTKQKVLTIATQLGVEVEDTAGALYLTTKKGLMFGGYFQHSLVLDYRGHGFPKPEAWIEAYIDLTGGDIVPCNIVECDYCLER